MAITYTIDEACSTPLLRVAETATMQAAGGEPQWITYINALSTAAVAFFALVELLRGRGDRRRRERVATARIAVIGENLERMIRSWNERFPMDAVHRIDRPANDADLQAFQEWLDITMPEFQAAQDHMLRIVEHSVEAPGRSMQNVQSASVKTVERHGAGAQPAGGDASRPARERARRGPHGPRGDAGGGEALAHAPAGEMTLYFLYACPRPPT
jgi:hypothetical protein